MNVINFEQKACERIRRYLDSYLSNELLVETNHEVLKHLESCQSCAEALAVRTRVKNLLREAVQREVAPAALREKVQRKLRSSPVQTNWVLAAVAAALVISFGGWSLFRWAGTRNAPEPLAAVLQVGLKDHIHCAVGKWWRGRSLNPQELGPDYIGLLPVVEQKVPPDYQVKIAHRCSVDGREYVHLILQKEEKILSLVITKKNGASFPRSGLAPALHTAGILLYEAQLQGYEVAGFETRDYLAFVVSDLNRGDNLQIVSNLTPSVHGFLAKLES